MSRRKKAKEKKVRIKDVHINFWITREDYERWILPVVLSNPNMTVSDMFRNCLKYFYYLNKYPIYRQILDELIENGIHGLKEFLNNILNDVINNIKTQIPNNGNVNININISNLINRVETLIEKVDYLLQATSIDKVVVVSIPQYIIHKINDVVELATSILKMIIDEKSRQAWKSFKTIIAMKMQGIDKVLKEMLKIVKDLESKYRMNIDAIAEKTNSKEIKRLLKVKNTLQLLKQYALNEVEMSEVEVKNKIIEALMN